MAQPPLSAAIRQLEQQLGVELLDRSSRQVRLTVAGEQMLEQGRELLAHADTVVGDVQAVERSPSGLLRGGLSPAARFGLVPDLLERWSTAAPGVMLHTREDTTGALLRDVREGRLDLAVVFCPPAAAGLASTIVRDEPAVVHVRDDHPLAGRPLVALDELAGETLLVAGGKDSSGYTAAVLDACRAAGFEPHTRPDPYPDLGVQAVREGLGIVLYVRTAFGPLAHRCGSRRGRLHRRKAVLPGTGDVTRRVPVLVRHPPDEQRERRQRGEQHDLEDRVADPAAGEEPDRSGRDRQDSRPQRHVATPDHRGPEQDRADHDPQEESDEDDRAGARGL